jgi:hypothetical protein
MDDDSDVFNDLRDFIEIGDSNIDASQSGLSLFAQDEAHGCQDVLCDLRSEGEEVSRQGVLCVEEEEEENGFEPFEEEFVNKFIDLYLQIYHDCLLHGNDHIALKTSLKRHTFDKLNLFSIYYKASQDEGLKDAAIKQVVSRWLFGEERCDIAQKVFNRLYTVRHCDDAKSTIVPGDLVWNGNACVSFNTKQNTISECLKSKPKKKGILTHGKNIPHISEGCEMNTQETYRLTNLHTSITTVYKISNPSITLTKLFHFWLQEYNRLVQMSDIDLFLCIYEYHFENSANIAKDMVEYFKTNLKNVEEKVRSWPRLKLHMKADDDMQQNKVRRHLIASNSYSMFKLTGQSEESDFMVSYKRGTFANYTLQLTPFVFRGEDNTSSSFPCVGSPCVSSREGKGVKREWSEYGTLESTKKKQKLNLIESSNFKKVIEFRQRFENLHTRFYHELTRFLLFQEKFYSVATKYILIVFPNRREYKTVRSLIPFNSRFLYHMPLFWPIGTAKSPLPGISFHSIECLDYFQVEIDNRKLDLLNHLYLAESNSYIFKPIHLKDNQLFYK